MPGHAHGIHVHCLIEKGNALCTKTASLVGFSCNEAWTEKSAYYVLRGRVDPHRSRAEFIIREIKAAYPLNENPIASHAAAVAATTLPTGG